MRTTLFSSIAILVCFLSAPVTAAASEIGQETEGTKLNAGHPAKQSGTALQHYARLKGAYVPSPSGRGFDFVEEEAPPPLEVGSVFQDCAVCPEMVVLPSGSFERGEGGATVTLSKQFAVSRFEITFREWDACVADGGCGGYSPSDEGWGRGTRPVIYVDWADATAYTQWLSQKTGATYRLLTEAEWEYAARGGTSTVTSFGDTITTRFANFNGEDYLGQTVPVGSYPPNAFGLYDMHGNVFEWGEDCWQSGTADLPTDGSALVGGDCSRRTLRGGSWEHDDFWIGSGFRANTSAAHRGSDEGIRVARDLEGLIASR